MADDETTAIGTLDLERTIFTEYIEGTSVDLRPIAGSHERFLE